jgi:hypothetical protein
MKIFLVFLVTSRASVQVQYLQSGLYQVCTVCVSSMSMYVPECFYLLIYFYIGGHRMITYYTE